jgi:hypothetical protein
MSRPSVVILCPREFKFTDHDAAIERPFLADVAALRTVGLDFDAIIPWHRPRVDAGTSARLARAAVLSEPLWNRVN